MNIAVRSRQSKDGLSPIEMDAMIMGWRPRSITVLLYGFVDESGEEGSDHKLIQLSLGGFFAPWESVKKLCELWRRALEVEALGSFHMREIASDEHNYSAWSAERQVRLDRFLDILCESAQSFFMYNFPTMTGVEKPFEDAYETGLARLTNIARSVAAREGERFRFVFAQTSQIKGQLIGRYFDNAGWDSASVWGEAILDSYQIARSDKSPPLQAAEIPARALARFKRDGTPTRSLAKIMQTGKPIDWWPKTFAI
jgi:hypothetical protein